MSEFGSKILITSDFESVKEQMVEAGEQSRMPTEAEYQAAVRTFHQAITDACIDKGE